MSGTSNGLRKPVTEAKEGHFGLRNEKDEGNMPGVGERGEKRRKTRVCSWWGRVTWVFCPKGL